MRKSFKSWKKNPQYLRNQEKTLTDTDILLVQLISHLSLRKKKKCKKEVESKKSFQQEDNSLFTAKGKMQLLNWGWGTVAWGERWLFLGNRLMVNVSEVALKQWYTSSVSARMTIFRGAYCEELFWLCTFWNKMDKNEETDGISIS